MGRKRPLTGADRWVAAGVFVGAGTVFGLGFGASSYMNFEHNGTPILAATIVGITTGLLFGAGMTVFVVASWKTNGGRTLQIAINRAVKARALPVHADPETWLPVLARRLEETRRWRLANPILFSVVALLGIGSAVVARNPVYATFIVCLVVLVIGVVIFGVATRRCREQAIVDLIEKLEALEQPKTRGS
jgi:hypothetical protein